MRATESNSPVLQQRPSELIGRRQGPRRSGGRPSTVKAQGSSCCTGGGWRRRVAVPYKHSQPPDPAPNSQALRPCTWRLLAAMMSV